MPTRVVAEIESLSWPSGPKTVLPTHHQSWLFASREQTTGSQTSGFAFHLLLFNYHHAYLPGARMYSIREALILSACGPGWPIPWIALHETPSLNACFG